MWVQTPDGVLVNLDHYAQVQVHGRRKVEFDDAGNEIEVRDEGDEVQYEDWSVVARLSAGGQPDMTLATVPTELEARDLLEQLASALRKPEAVLQSTTR